MNEAPRFYRPELDALRFFAFSMVYVWHAFPGSTGTYAKFLPAPAAAAAVSAVHGGAFGVDLFFALSAYLITEILLREYRQAGAIDVRAFYARRVLRIWPLYFFMLIVAAPLLNHFDGQRFTSGYLAAFALFGGNWACAVWGFAESSLTPLWSVSVEEQFYVVWPWLVGGGRRLLIWVCLSLLVVGVASREVLMHKVPHPGVWCNTLARLDSIAGGALLAAFLDGRKLSLHPVVRALLLGCGLTALVSAGSFGRFDGVDSRWMYPLAALGSVSMLCGVLGVDWNPGFLGQRFIYLGRISYGLYVFHVMAIHFTHVPSPSAARWAENLGLSFSLTVVLAAISYRFLESPFLNFKRRFSFVQSAPAREAG